MVPFAQLVHVELRRHQAVDATGCPSSKLVVRFHICDLDLNSSLDGFRLILNPTWRSSFFSERLTEFPTLAVIAPNEPLGIGSVGGAHLFCIPLDFLAGAKRDVAKVVGLSQQTGIFEVAQCRSPAFACDDPVEPVRRQDASDGDDI